MLFIYIICIFPSNENSHTNIFVQVTAGVHLGSCAFAKKNVQPTTDLKKYIEAIKRFLHHSSSFYAVTINSTFIKQDRVYFTKEFSQNYIKPLMEGKKPSTLKYK